MFGIDPFMAMGIICIGFGAVGWLIGPFAGGFLFRLTHRKVARAMEVVSCCPSLSYNLDELTRLARFRKRKIFISVSRSTEAILQGNQYRTPYRITTVKRSFRLEDTGSG